MFHVSSRSNALPVFAQRAYRRRLGASCLSDRSPRHVIFGYR